MKRLTIIIFLILITQSATALNDINISMDSGSVTICLSEKELQNQTCNTTYPLTLDGSKDHMLYFTPKYEVKHSDDFKENMRNYVFYMIETPVAMLYGSIFLIFILLIGSYVTQYIIRYVKRNGFN